MVKFLQVLYLVRCHHVQPLSVYMYPSEWSSPSTARTPPTHSREWIIDEPDQPYNQLKLQGPIL